MFGRDQKAKLFGIRAKTLAKRQKLRLRCIVEQQPATKRSIRAEIEVDFQKNVHDGMRLRGLGTFTCPVALRLDFTCGGKTPPDIHSLAKCYLDLLENPVPTSGIANPKLLYANDRLVEYLCVTCQYTGVGGHGDIHISAYPMSEFREELYFADEVRKVAEEAVGYDWRRSKIGAMIRGDHDSLTENTTEASSELRELLYRRDQAVGTPMEQFYDSMVWLQRQKVQEAYLTSMDVTLRMVETLLRKQAKISRRVPAFMPDEYKARVRAMNRETSKFLAENLAGMKADTFRDPALLDLGPNAMADGESKAFKENVQKQLEAEARRSLFPLLVPISLTIFHQPGINQGLDLDNLARRVLPFVAEIWKPPVNELVGVRDKLGPPPGHPDAKEIHTRLDEIIDAIPKAKRFAILSYEVFSVPRQKADDHAGRVKMAMAHAQKHELFWDQVGEVVDYSVELAEKLNDRW